MDVFKSLKQITIRGACLPIPTVSDWAHLDLTMNSLKEGCEFVLMIVVTMGVGRKVALLWGLVQEEHPLSISICSEGPHPLTLSPLLSKCSSSLQWPQNSAVHFREITTRFLQNHSFLSCLECSFQSSFLSSFLPPSVQSCCWDLFWRGVFNQLTIATLFSLPPRFCSGTH